MRSIPPAVKVVAYCAIGFVFYEFTFFGDIAGAFVFKVREVAAHELQSRESARAIEEYESIQGQISSNAGSFPIDKANPVYRKLKAYVEEEGYIIPGEGGDNAAQFIIVRGGAYAFAKDSKSVNPQYLDVGILFLPKQVTFADGEEQHQYTGYGLYALSSVITADDDLNGYSLSDATFSFPTPEGLEALKGTEYEGKPVLFQVGGANYDNIGEQKTISPSKEAVVAVHAPGSSGAPKSKGCLIPEEGEDAINSIMAGMRSSNSHTVEVRAINLGVLQ
jgi:hypothetical protein